MKYLHIESLGRLGSQLSSNPLPESRVQIRFEAYSVKPIGKERKQFKEMEEAYMSGQEELEEMSFSPEMKEAGLSSCFGRLDEKESRKMHFMLVSCLNSAFPDYDFSGLRPDHFTREISAWQVLNHLSGSLMGPASAELLSAPAQSPGSSNLLYSTLSEAVALEDAEVYSWFPEPEYDPHMEPEDGEASDSGSDVDVDMDMEAAWGQAGMELEMDEPSVAVKKEVRLSSRLLWSANYFFHNRRQKRMLFITAWCRKRSGTALTFDHAFPAPISASYTAPSAFTASYKPRTHNSANSRRRSKPQLKVTGTIPIRQETPRPMSASAPAAPSVLNTPQSALAKMTAGGFKPRQTPARVLINTDRIRKERSESRTPSLLEMTKRTRV